jgi:predicted kinase
MLEELKKYDIVLVVGNYGAGKSYLAKNSFKERKRIDRHQVRHHLKEMTEHGARWKAEDWNEDLEGLIKHIEHDIICHFLERNEKIIIDNTSLTKKSRKRYIENARRYNKTIACVYLQRDTSTLLEQNKRREFPVPDHIIVQLYTKTESPTVDEGFDTVVYV